MATTTAAVKKRKKSWYGIYGPNIMKNAYLGESTVFSKEDLVGKRLSLNLSTFTNDMRKQNMDVTFNVVTVTDNKAISEVIGTALTNAYVKRLVRRGKNKVDDSFTALTKDKKNLRLKSIIITNAKTNRSVTSRLRLEMRKILATHLKTTSAEEFFNSVIYQHLQKDLKEKLSKIYPVKYVDVRIAKIEKGKSTVQVPDVQLEQKAATDEEMKEAAKEEKEVSKE